MNVPLTCSIVTTLHSGNVYQLQTLKEEDKDYYISCYEGFIAMGITIKSIEDLWFSFLESMVSIQPNSKGFLF